MAALRRLLRAARAHHSQHLWPSAHSRLMAAQSPGPHASSSALLLVSGAAGAGLALACYAAYRSRNIHHPGERQHRHMDPRVSPEEGWPGRGVTSILVPVSAAKETSSADRSEAEDLDMFASSREQRFRTFASLEYDGQLYMTPRDFLESVTTDEPKRSKKWKTISRQDLNQILLDTPPVWKGSSRLFRTLGDKGMISYTEYLFLLCILTKPHAGFKIAFNMFDTDGNEMVDREEFLVLQEIFRKKNEKKERKGDEEKCAQLVMYFTVPLT